MVSLNAARRQSAARLLRRIKRWRAEAETRAKATAEIKLFVDGISWLLDIIDSNVAEQRRETYAHKTATFRRVTTPATSSGAVHRRAGGSERHGSTPSYNGARR